MKSAQLDRVCRAVEAWPVDCSHSWEAIKTRSVVCVGIPRSLPKVVGPVPTSSQLGFSALASVHSALFVADVVDSKTELYLYEVERMIRPADEASKLHAVRGRILRYLDLVLSNSRRHHVGLINGSQSTLNSLHSPRGFSSMESAISP